MAKDDGQGSQLNLTVVALVALVAIVGLVALVLNTASLAKISTGSQAVSADSLSVADENAIGQMLLGVDCSAWTQTEINAMVMGSHPVLKAVGVACNG